LVDAENKHAYHFGNPKNYILWETYIRYMMAELVARVPSVRPVVECGGLLAVLRDCCRSFGW